MKRGIKRKERVSDLIQRTLANILITGMDNKKFRLVTITGVSVSSDLSYAKIYISIFTEEEEERKAVFFALNHAANKMRYYLAKEVKLRIVPELKFIYDESTKQGFMISHLIDQAMKKINNVN